MFVGVFRRWNRTGGEGQTGESPDSAGAAGIVCLPVVGARLCGRRAGEREVRIRVQCAWDRLTGKKSVLVKIRIEAKRTKQRKERNKQARKKQERNKQAKKQEKEAKS